MRKNKISGAIKGSGRPKKDYVKKNINITPEAAEVLKMLKFGEMSKWVSDAIISHSLTTRLR